MNTVHTLGLFHEYQTPEQYSVQDFLRIARTTQLAATIIACDLYRIPVRSSFYHEFLLVHTERLVFIIERVPTNSGMRVISSNGGAARDTITIVQAREHHEYWRSAGRNPVCKTMLRWHQPSPRLFDIVFIASVASTIFKHYNLYVRQCYFYARITLDALARAFPSCSRQGTTSFSRGWFAMLGSYKPSQVQLLVDIHAIGCQEIVPAIEAERHASRLVTLDIPLHFGHVYCQVSWIRH
ncbi:hypothetical protein F5141DRAFT_1212976 [Pisolithus sp. B1]|nr:hypothetical protein F5141DRAFT_1212976 [Pisolithus sp. B1]